jgi:hypothetical protein
MEPPFSANSIIPVLGHYQKRGGREMGPFSGPFRTGKRKEHNMTFRIFGLLVAGLIASSPAASADVIYDNIGAMFPGQYLITYGGTYAFQFTAGSTAYASSVDVPIVAASAVTVTMRLYADSGTNSVGTLLETFQLTSDTPPVNLVTANMSGLTLLTSGNKYWLEAASSSEFSWYTSNTASGPYAFFNGEYSYFNSIIGAFRINVGSTAIAATLSGFYPPVDSPAIGTNLAKAGQTIPLRFYAQTAQGPITDLTTVDLSIVSTDCEQLDEGLDAIESYSTETSVPLENLGGGSYQYNWKTQKGATGCRVITLTLPETYTADHLVATFKFRK